jgi:hypothetical protein
MSKALDIADAIAARLNALNLLGGQKVIVWKQKDIAGEVKAQVERGIGSSMMLFYEGFDQEGAANGVYPAVTRNYTLRILSRPVLGIGKPTADALLESAALSLHQWDPAEVSGISEIIAPKGALVEDDEHLIYDLTLTVKSKL